MATSIHHARSISYPPKTNPFILNIEQQLKKLQESEASSTSPMQAISIGLNGLAGLYKCIHDALNYLPILPEHNTSNIEQLVNGSSKILDLYCSSSEALGRLRGAVGELRSSGEKHMEVSRYFCTRKEIVRNAKGLAMRLRQVEEELISENRKLSKEEAELTRVIRCVSIISISVLESLLQLLSSKPPRSSRFSLISKILGGRSKEAEALPSSRNELSNVDAVLQASLSRDRGDEDKIAIAKKGLEGLEEGLRGIEKGVSCISSQLTKTRASLVNIISF